MKQHKIIRFFLAFLLSLALVSCTQSGGDDTEDRSEDSPSDGGGTARTNCGAVINGKVVNPVSDGNGEPVTIAQATDANTLIVNTQSGGAILVKLHGVSNEPAALRQNAIETLRRFNGQLALFVRAGDQCTATVSGGGNAQVGQLFTSDGVSLAEEVIRTGFVSPSASDGCSSELITSCYSALAESDPVTAGPLGKFLWKPVSDSNGRLAVHSEPFQSTVFVNGEVGVNAGPGNGYGSLARFSKPGCAYGAAQVQIRSSTGLVYTVGGKTTFTIPNGCQRYCIVDSGEPVPCSK